jgi:5-methylcytosine-specific restriction endonuclease McrA
MPGKPKRRRGRGRHHAAVTADSHATSVPTNRAAYADTRKWLLKQHGPVCAYCGVKWPPRTMTLDHVTPRRGLTAYDRRDNLVLACTRCNTLKADKPFLAFLFAQRARAKNLLRYGDHLSEGILDLCRSLAGDVAPAPAVEPRVVYGNEDDGESPYSDSPYAPDPPSGARTPHKPSRKPARRRRRKPR